MRHAVPSIPTPVRWAQPGPVGHPGTLPAAAHLASHRALRRLSRLKCCLQLCPGPAAIKPSLQRCVLPGWRPGMSDTRIQSFGYARLTPGVYNLKDKKINSENCPMWLLWYGSWISILAQYSHHLPSFKLQTTCFQTWNTLILSPAVLYSLVKAKIDVAGELWWLTWTFWWLFFSGLV